MIRRGLKTLFHWAIALLLLFEEWGWEPLGRLLARLARLPVIGYLERRIALLPPWAALAAFALPALALLPVKIAALWLIAKGHAASGVAVIVIAKLAGTALMARLYTLTRPALMRMPWFAHYFMRWTAWKEAILAQVRASAAWRAIHAAKASVRALMLRIKSNYR